MDDDLEKQLNDLVIKLQEKGIAFICLAEHKEGYLYVENQAAEDSQSTQFNCIRGLMECDGDLGLFLDKVKDEMATLGLEEEANSNQDKKEASDIFLSTNKQATTTQH